MGGGEELLDGERLGEFDACVVVVMVGLIEGVADALKHDVKYAGTSS